MKSSKEMKEYIIRKRKKNTVLRTLQWLAIFVFFVYKGIYEHIYMVVC